MSEKEVEAVAMEPPPPSYDAVVAGNWGGQQSNQGFSGPPPIQMNYTDESASYYNSSMYPPQPATAPGVETNLPPYPISNQPGLISPAPPPYIGFNGISPEHTASAGILPPTETPLPVETNANQTEATNDDDSETGVCAAFCAFSIFAAIPIAMFIIGISNQNNCPMEDKVPLFLMASGGLSILLAIFLVGIILSDDEGKLGRLFMFLFVFGFFVLFGVQIWGSYAVFRKWSDWNGFYKHVDVEYGCDRTTYLFSFSMLIIFWTLGPCIACTSKNK